MRTLLLGLIIFFAAWYVFRLFKPRKEPDELRGSPRSPRKGIPPEQIEDAKFKDIPDP